MEVFFSENLETKISRLAAQQGRDSNSIVVEAVERLVDYDEWFLCEVEKGLTQVEGKQTLSHEEVGRRLDRFMPSHPSRA
jgi:predicted transcriptional regulator